MRENNQLANMEWWKLGGESIIWNGYVWSRTDDEGQQYDGWELCCELMMDAYEFELDKFLKPDDFCYYVDMDRAE